jgi:hypothetical protein
LLAVTGGASRGDPCEAMAYHGFTDVSREGRATGRPAARRGRRRAR